MYKTYSQLGKVDETFTVLVVQSKAHRIELINTKPLLCIKVGAEWCPPCKAVMPEFTKLALEKSRDGISFCQIDLETDPEIQDAFAITAIPAFLLFRNSKLFKHVKGADLKELTKELDGLLKDSKGI